MMFALWILGYVISTRGLADIQNISYYKARKCCKELEKEGLIEFIREYIPDQFSYERELENEAFWNIGWRTTKKALEKEIWKQEEAEEERIRKEVWGDLDGKTGFRKFTKHNRTFRSIKNKYWKYYWKTKHDFISFKRLLRRTIGYLQWCNKNAKNISRE